MIIPYQVLVLGAGYVSAPVVEYLTRDKGTGVTVAAALQEEANKLASKYVGFDSYVENKLFKFKSFSLAVTSSRYRVKRACVCVKREYHRQMIKNIHYF